MFGFWMLSGGPAAAQEAVDLTRAAVIVRADAPDLETTAAMVLVEEVERRTGVRWRTASRWPESGPAVALLSGRDDRLHGRGVPGSARVEKAEGFGIATEGSTVWICGADPRGALFGAGRLLRSLECRPGSVRLPRPLAIATSPARPIRGHQLGFRATANSYDAWTPAQYDQYIRELALFGANSVENIPFQDTRPTAGGFPRDRMNVELSRICQRYGQDYWIWTPADFDLRDGARRAQLLRAHERLFQECPVLAGVFVPGGDPGSNPVHLVIPYLEDLARLLQRHHPRGRVWLSLQGRDGFEQDTVYRWIGRKRPKWLGGLVAGPSSPPLRDIRARLPREYALRDYPDITHSVRCQFPVPWWDPAFAFTLGRECVNPRPVFFARVIRDTGPFTSGFITYSDGIHDDVNKAVWSALGWDPDASVNAVVTDYARLFFGPDVAEAAAAGILALERSWEGPLATNGSVDAVFTHWQALERSAPGLKENWRWQLCLLRACYDLYTRSRLLHETALEEEANAALLSARQAGSEAAIRRALEILGRADTARVRPELLARIEQLCADLHRSIGLQTSVPKHGASGLERGAVLDTVNYPLNNRWWLEDELAKVHALPDEAARAARLEEIARWENPGPGSFYDDIGHVGRSPRVARNERLESPLLDVDHASLPGVMFWVGDNPLARARQSWFTDESWPLAVRYPHVDPHAGYVIRTTGVGDCLLRVNGVRLAPTRDGRQVGEIKEFPVPRGLYRDGGITVTFDPTFEPHLNWRVQSRLTEIWLIRKDPGAERP